MTAWTKPFKRQGKRPAKGTIRRCGDSRLPLSVLLFALVAAVPAAAVARARGRRRDDVRRDDPYLPATQDLPPGPAGRAPATGRGTATAAAKMKKKKPTVDSELKRFLKARSISRSDYKAYLASWKRAQARAPQAHRPARQRARRGDLEHRLDGVGQAARPVAPEGDVPHPRPQPGAVVDPRASCPRRAPARSSTARRSCGSTTPGRASRSSRSARSARRTGCGPPATRTRAWHACSRR